jgi:hypothetical protein
MNKNLLPYAVCFAVACAAWTQAIPAQEKAPQDKPADEKKGDGDVPALLKELKEAVNAPKGAKDAEARQTIDKLVAAYDKAEAKLKKDTVKGLRDVFRAKRAPEAAEVFVAATEGLSKMGADGARALEQMLEDKPYKNEKEWQTFRGQAIEALGKTQDKSAVKPLLDIAIKDKYDRAVAAAGKALGNFGNADEKTRKEIVEELVKQFNAIYNGSKQSVDPNNSLQQTFVEKYNAIQEPWNNSLAQLTGQSFREPPQWQSWWNDNKNKKWPDQKPKDAKAEKSGGTPAPGK